MRRPPALRPRRARTRPRKAYLHDRAGHRLAQGVADRAFQGPPRPHRKDDALALLSRLERQLDRAGADVTRSRRLDLDGARRDPLEGKAPLAVADRRIGSAGIAKGSRQAALAGSDR